jgi:hypothetical protein
VRSFWLKKKKNRFNKLEIKSVFSLSWGLPVSRRVNLVYPPHYLLSQCQTLFHSRVTCSDVNLLSLVLTTLGASPSRLDHRKKSSFRDQEEKFSSFKTGDSNLDLRTWWPSNLPTVSIRKDDTKRGVGPGDNRCTYVHVLVRRVRTGREWGRVGTHKR